MSMFRHINPDEGLDTYRCESCQQSTCVTHILQRDGHHICEDCDEEQGEQRRLAENGPDDSADPDGPWSGGFAANH